MKSAMLFAALIALAPGPTVAATHSKTQRLSVRGSVLQNCLMTTQAIRFPNIGAGYIDPPGRSVLVQSSLDMRCTKGASVRISMDTGLYGNAAGANFGSRSMKAANGKKYVGYELCHDAACANAWTPSGFTYVSPSDAGSSLSVWARILSGQHPTPDSYSDSVTVTVSF